MSTFHDISPTVYEVLPLHLWPSALNFMIEYQWHIVPSKSSEQSPYTLWKHLLMLLIRSWLPEGCPRHMKGKMKIVNSPSVTIRPVSCHKISNWCFKDLHLLTVPPTFGSPCWAPIPVERCHYFWRFFHISAPRQSVTVDKLLFKTSKASAWWMLSPAGDNWNAHSLDDNQTQSNQGFSLVHVTLNYYNPVPESQFACIAHLEFLSHRSFSMFYEFSEIILQYFFIKWRKSWKKDIELITQGIPTLQPEPPFPNFSLIVLQMSICLSKPLLTICWDNMYHIISYLVSLPLSSCLSNTSNTYSLSYSCVRA